MIDVEERACVVAGGAAQWRDPSSAVRARARAALRDSEWSPAVVEAALDNVLFDLDMNRVRSAAVQRQVCAAGPVLVLLPGNVIGPAVASAYCAVAAGAQAILKSPGAERLLAPIVAQQLDELGPPCAGLVSAEYWTGGDEDVERNLFAAARTVIVFGTDATIASVRRRARNAIAYGSAYSVGLVGEDADVGEAADAAARDVCMFDQRGCMSPQTIYVLGDPGRALLYAHALASALRRIGVLLPRARLQPGEAALVADALRRISLSAAAPQTHGLDTVIAGPSNHGVPEFIVGVEGFGPPALHGFGRIVIVKPCDDASRLSLALNDAKVTLDSVGCAGHVASPLRSALERTFARVCALGEMQRPPFGYRPKVSDFQ